MKFKFLAVSMLCAIALSVLSAILASGHIPFRPNRAAVVSAPVPSVPLEDDNGRTLRDLADALQNERRVYQNKENELASREKAVQQQQAILELLKKEVQDLQRALDEKVVRLTEADVVNSKRLADMCGKMEAGSAAALLKELEPERAAAIVGLLGERQAAGVLDAAVASGGDGTKIAAQWSDIIRRTASEKGKTK